MYLIIVFSFYLAFRLCGEGDYPISITGCNKITSYDKIPVTMTNHYLQS